MNYLDQWYFEKAMAQMNHMINILSKSMIVFLELMKKRIELEDKERALQLVLVDNKIKLLRWRKQFEMPKWKYSKLLSIMV